MKQQPFLDEAFDKGLQLAFPPVMVQLLKALLEPEPSFDTIAGYLEMDALLAGKVLHIVNTGNYGFTEKFTSLHRAAVAIGTSDLFKLVISLSLQKKLHPAPSRKPEHMYADWRLTLWSALAAEAIADKLCPKYRGEAYLGGILKDLPVYLALCPDDAPVFLTRDGPATMYSTSRNADELGHWGRPHAEIARDILLFWGLPEELCEAVRIHHDLGAAAHGSSLDKSLIFGTRWAELLHAPEPDPGELVAFELSLAAELELDEDGLEEFRTACASRFNALSGQLGIRRGRPEEALYEKSLTSIQSCYFLALGALRDIAPRGSIAMAATLQQQLRLFWGVAAWRLRLALPFAGDELCFLCDKGAIRQVKPEKQDMAPPPGWTSLFLTVGGARYGRLDVCMAQENVQQSSLPTFVHMLALCLDESRRQKSGGQTCLSMEPLPFVLARIDAEGNITDATGRFLDTFGISAVSPGMRAANLLEERLGIRGASFDALPAAAGRILTVPEGKISGTPVYLARPPAPDTGGGSYVLLGEASGLSEAQLLALGHPGFLEALLDRSDDLICLLDGNGQIQWATGPARGAVGKSVFSLVKPEDIAVGAWNAAFLAQVLEPVTLSAAIPPGKESRDVMLSPLAGAGPKRYLMAVRRAQGTGAAVERPAAKRDPLTGLYGYSQFHSLLKHFSEIAEKTRIALGIIFCNIQGLEGINREHGHLAGDAVLRRTADVLIGACRKGLDFPCRYYSDNFALLVSRGTPPLMDSMATRILQLVGEEEDPLLHLHIGLSLVEPGQNPKSRLDAARRECKKAAGLGEPFRWAK